MGNSNLLTEPLAISAGTGQLVEETINIDLVLQRALAQDSGFCFGSDSNTIKCFDPQQKLGVLCAFDGHLRLEMIK
eukprot:4915584-Heterocapsa_arctica.AAC.1